MSGAQTRLIRVNDRGYPVGQDHHRAKLTDHEVDLILELAADGMSYRTIADKFEISFRHVGRLVHGEKRSQLITTTVRRACYAGGHPAIGPADLDEFDIVGGVF